MLYIIKTAAVEEKYQFPKMSKNGFKGLAISKKPGSLMTTQ